MTCLGVTGVGVLCSAGLGVNQLALQLTAAKASPARGELTTVLGAELPCAHAHVVPSFDAKALLGRKTTFINRATALALVGCAQAIEDRGGSFADDPRRIGVVLGTTLGSLRSMSDYTLETLVEQRPYLVNPALFPNTVMNCAAGQVAIRFGLKGINATLAAGEVAFFSSLSYADNALRCGASDTLLGGAVEELSATALWGSYIKGGTAAAEALGEAAAVFVLQDAARARAEGRRVEAEIPAVRSIFMPARLTPDERRQRCVACIEAVLRAAGVAASQVRTSLLGPRSSGDAWTSIEREATAAVLGEAAVETIRVDDFLGQCGAASGGIQLAALLALHRSQPERSGQYALLTATTADGAFAAALVRGWGHAGTAAS